MRIRRLLSRLCTPLNRCSRERRIRTYLSGGRRPWSKGYVQYREQVLTRTFADDELMDIFAQDHQLPANYGTGLDERVIEYPWTLMHLRKCGLQILDAGSALNHEFLLNLPAIRDRAITIITLAPEGFLLPRANVSYLFGDLRNTIVRDASMAGVTCISTLEHIGMDNTLMYTQDRSFNETNLHDYKKVLHEMRRVLAPGGFSLITVPFGKKENHGWLQQFDLDGIHDILHAFGGRCDDLRFYQYTATGWRRAQAAECASAEYYNIHARTSLDADNAAAARAVACMRLSAVD